MEHKTDLYIPQNITKRKRSDASEETIHSDVKHLRTDDGVTSHTVSYYEKREGTSGFGGLLYATKLQTLVLLRALTRKEIERFLLGSIVHHIGAFDDLVLKFYERGQTKPKLLLVQTKHKDDPKKHNITIGEVNNKGGDINIKKHFQSFLQINSNFRSSSENTFLDTSLDETDHKFIIYTNAENDLSEEVVEISTPSVDDMLYSGQEGKILRFKSHYMKSLLCTLMEWRIARLAESLSNFVLSDGNSYSEMMSDEFIKCYHPLLARHVLHVSTEIFEDKSNKKETKYYRESKFVSEFLNTEDDTISILRETLYKRIATHKKSLLSLKEISNVIDEVTFSQKTISKLKANKKEMKIDQFKNELKMQEPQETITEAVNVVNRMKVESLLFRVPSTFGNLDCAVMSQTQLDHICTKIAKLYKNRKITNGNVICIDRNSIGSHEILNDEDIEVIGTFVGNLLVLEEETQMFIFNVDEDSLLKHAKQGLGVLKSKLSDILKDCKFQIDFYDFPRLSLYNRYTDDNIVSHFLNTFKIYTNQANESGVEELLIEEIAKYYNNDNKNKKRLRIKNRAMFLKVHDDIQKWWKQKEKIVPCLDENCKFFDQAKSDNNPLLTILNIMYTDNFNKNIEFEYDSIEILKLYDFMTTSHKRILHIVSEYHVLTAMKLNQYLNINNPDKYRFVDLDYVMKNRYVSSEVYDELNKAALDVVIIKYQERTLQEEFLDDLVKDITVKKIILISNNVLSEENAFIKDDRNNLVNLTFQSQENVLESIIIFQGEETPLSTIIDNEAKCLVNSEVLNKLVNNETITIGKTPTNTHYESIKSYYIDRQLNRYIKINKKIIKCDGKVNEEILKKMHVVYDDDQIDQLKANEDYDIMLVSNEEQHFHKLCEQYPGLYIHWFKRDNKDLVWNKSRGRLKRIFKYLDEDDFEDFFTGADFGYRMEFCNEDLQLDNEQDIDMPDAKKITDIEDKIVIISGEPGMGKSTLLTHLSIEKKKRDTLAWIVKVNLVDLSSEFRNWKESKIKYDQVVRFLYKAIDFQAINENNDQNKKYKEKKIENIISTVTVNNNNEIALNKKEKRLQGSNLFEIEVFNYLHNRGRYIVMLDGFDAIIPDYKKEVIDLLKILKQSKVERLWITTRSYNIQTELEDNLHTFSYGLDPFSSDDQMKFLEKFWTVHLELKEMKDTSSLKTFYSAMMTFYNSFTDHDISFTSIPQHIYMIATIFKDIFKEYYDGNMKNDCKDFSNKNINNMIVYLYEQYIDIKVREIFFEKKIHFKNMDDPSMKDIVEDKKQQIIKNHKLLAIHTIFNAVDISGLFSMGEENEIQELISKIETGKERMGFVDRIVNGQARFVHKTFAEYFAAVFLCDVVKCNSNPDFVWEFLIGMVFETFHNVRIFFDGIMACDSELNNFMSNTEHKEIIFNLLLKQGTDPNNSTTALSYALIDNLDKILRVLVNSLEGNVNENNLDDFIQLVRKGDFLPNAIKDCRKDIAENVFRIVKEIDRSKLIDIVHYMDEYTESSSLIGALSSFNDEMLGIVLGDITDIELVSIFKIKDPTWSNRTLLHQLYGGFKLEQLELHLVKLNMDQLMEVAIVPDDYGRTAAHYAGKHLGVYFLQFFEKHLQKDDLRTLCLSRDVDGKTVRDYLEQKMENMNEEEINWYTDFRMALISLDD